LGITSEYRILEKFKHNILSVIFDSDSFFYAISDLNNNLNLAVKYQLEEDPLVEIPVIIKEETLDQHYYSSVNIFSKIDKFTFVPSSEYTYGDEQAFIRNSFKSESDHFGLDLSAKEHLTIIHGFDQSFQKAFSSLISGQQNFRHLSLAYIEGIDEDGVHCSVYKDSLIIFVRNQGQFLFYNQFKAVSIEEKMYFVMLTFDQLNLDPNASKLVIDGSKEYVDSLKLMLSDYLAKIDVVSNSFANLDNVTDLHDLYLAAICE
jgi:hypothetical protein